MKTLYLFFTILVIISACLVIDQIWFDFISAGNFWKIITTIGVIGGAVILVFFIRHEFLGNKKLKDNDFVD